MKINIAENASPTVNPEKSPKPNSDHFDTPYGGAARRVVATIQNPWGFYYPVVNPKPSDKIVGYSDPPDLRGGNDVQAGYALGEPFDGFGTDPGEYERSVSFPEIVNRLVRALPPSPMAESIGQALLAKLNQHEDLIVSTQEKCETGYRTIESRGVDYERYNQGLRDLVFAINGIAKALAYDEYGNNAEPYDTFVSRDKKSWQSRNNRDNYYAVFKVFNDSYFDQGDQEMINEQAELSGLWPDEYYYGAQLEIKITPDKRIEFVYTPDLEASRSRHHSVAEVYTYSDRLQRYENEALSIRLDVDPKAPHGVALDIGRSAYDGETNGRRIVRTGDLLGDIYAEASPSGNHEYAGFNEQSLSLFRPFAESLALQLHLQKGVIEQ